MSDADKPGSNFKQLKLPAQFVVWVKQEAAARQVPMYVLVLDYVEKALGISGPSEIRPWEKITVRRQAFGRPRPPRAPGAGRHRYPVPSTPPDEPSND